MKLNKSSLLLSLLIFSPIIADTRQTSAQTEPSELGKWGNLSLYYLKQLPPLAISATIGALAGGACGIFFADLANISKKDPTKAGFAGCIALGIMLTEMYTRSVLVNELQKDLDAQHISHKKGLMGTTAWISSWLAFLAAGDARLAFLAAVGLNR